MTKHIFIGFDPRDELAGKIAVRSMLRHARLTASDSIKVVLVKEHELRRKGLYWRSYEVKPNGQMIDDGDGKPFSTNFSFTRFCVPELARQMGIHEPVLFMDPDMMFRADIRGLFEQWNDKYSVMCVQHNHMPKEAVKFDGIEQTKYFRKNWSSLMLLHPDKTANLNPHKASTWTGAQLHALLWTADAEIGALDPTWNHLVGYDTPRDDASLVHFTLGTPDIPGCENCEYAEEWRGYCEAGEVSPVSQIALEQNVWKQSRRGGL